MRGPLFARLLLRVFSGPPVKGVANSVHAFSFVFTRVTRAGKPNKNSFHMKKSFLFSIRSCLYILLLLLAIAIPQKAAAYPIAYTVDRIVYAIYTHGYGANLVADSAHVTGTNGASDVHIPSSITYTYTYTEKVNNQDITITRSVSCPVTAIGQYAFKGSNITRFSMENNIRAFVIYYNNEFHSSHRLDFSGCTKLKHASLGERITSYTFQGCVSLTSVSLPQSPTHVENYCFENCHSLTSFDFSNLTAIGYYAFNNCYSLSSHITIPESLQSIGGCSFERYYDDEGNPPPIIEELEWNAINCRLYLPDFYKSNIKGYVDSSSYTPFPNHIRHLRIGPNVKYVGNSIFNFYGWTNNIGTDVLSFNSTNYEGIYLRGPWINDQIIISGNVKTLPRSLVWGNITQITVPASVTLTRSGVVWSCDSLKTIYWNAKSCTTEGPFSSSSCWNLCDIIIGSGVNYIGGRAFYHEYGGSTLSTMRVTCHATVPPVIDADCFSNKTYNNATLYVPKGSLEAYRNAVGWKEFFKCVAIEDIPGGGDDKLLGDANDDGKVNIEDVTTLINYLLKGYVTPFNAVNADVDEDGSINIADVTTLINLLLKGN